MVDGVEGSAYSSVTGNGVCGQVYIVPNTLATSGCLNSAQLLQQGFAR